MSCKPRHRYRGKDHADGCDAEPGGHWHITCRGCGWGWVQLELFPREAAA